MPQCNILSSGELIKFFRNPQLNVDFQLLNALENISQPQLQSILNRQVSAAIVYYFEQQTNLVKLKQVFKPGNSSSTTNKMMQVIIRTCLKPEYRNLHHIKKIYPRFDRVMSPFDHSGRMKYKNSHGEDAIESYHLIQLAKLNYLNTWGYDFRYGHPENLSAVLAYQTVYDMVLGSDRFNTVLQELMKYSANLITETAGKYDFECFRLIKDTGHILGLHGAQTFQIKNDARSKTTVCFGIDDSDNAILRLESVNREYLDHLQQQYRKLTDKIAAIPSASITLPQSTLTADEKVPDIKQRNTPCQEQKNVIPPQVAVLKKELLNLVRLQSIVSLAFDSSFMGTAESCKKALENPVCIIPTGYKAHLFYTAILTHSNSKQRYLVYADRSDGYSLFGFGGNKQYGAYIFQISPTAGKNDLNQFVDECFRINESEEGWLSANRSHQRAIGKIATSTQPIATFPLKLQNYQTCSFVNGKALNGPIYELLTAFQYFDLRVSKADINEMETTDTQQLLLEAIQKHFLIAQRQGCLKNRYKDYSYFIRQNHLDKLINTIHNNDSPDCVRRLSFSLLITFVRQHRQKERDFLLIEYLYSRLNPQWRQKFHRIITRLQQHDKHKQQLLKLEPNTPRYQACLDKIMEQQQLDENCRRNGDYDQVVTNLAEELLFAASNQQTCIARALKQSIDAPLLQKNSMILGFFKRYPIFATKFFTFLRWDTITNAGLGYFKPLLPTALQLKVLKLAAEKRNSSLIHNAVRNNQPVRWSNHLPQIQQLMQRLDSRSSQFLKTVLSQKVQKASRMTQSVENTIHILNLLIQHTPPLCDINCEYSDEQFQLASRNFQKLATNTSTLFKLPLSSHQDQTATRDEIPCAILR